LQVIITEAKFTIFINLLGACLINFKKKNLEIKELEDACRIHFECGREEYENLCKAQYNIKSLMTSPYEANNEKENLIKQIHKFEFEVDAYDNQQAKLCKKNESLHALT